MGCIEQVKNHDSCTAGGPCGLFKPCDDTMRCTTAGNASPHNASPLACIAGMLSASFLMGNCGCHCSCRCCCWSLWWCMVPHLRCYGLRFAHSVAPHGVMRARLLLDGTISAYVLL